MSISSRHAYKERRKMVSRIIMWLSTVSAVIGIAFLFWILIILIFKGLNGLSLDVFMNDMAPPGIPDGGLRNAFVGQGLLVGFAILFGVPIGMLAGIYLSEYGMRSKFANFIRNMSDIMMSAPSIVIGIFVYAAFQPIIDGYSGWAGSTALAIMMVPIILKVTDDMLSLVPVKLREAAAALGAPKYLVILQVVLRGARHGLLTGIVLAIARIAGETAPLLFTSLSNNFFSTDMDKPMSSLTVTIYNYANSPEMDWQQLGWTGAFLLAVFVLTINLLGRFIIARKKEK